MGTCYSGIFVPKLSKTGRVIITSSDAEEQSLAGITVNNQATTTTLPGGGDYFIDSLFNFLGRGDNFKDATIQASANIALRDTRKTDSGKHSGVYDTLAQHPLLDDDGDGTAIYAPASTTDGAVAANGSYY